MAPSQEYPKEVPVANEGRVRRQWIQDPGDVALPYNQDKYYIPQHDPRWCNTKSGPEVMHQLIIDNRGYELPLGGIARTIFLDDVLLKIHASSKTREILVNDEPVYKIGASVAKLNITGHSHKLHYHGQMKQLWIDGVMYEVQFDAPPLRVTGIAREERWLQLDMSTGDVIVDDVPVCKYDTPARKIQIGNKSHSIQFVSPPRQIRIGDEDRLCDVEFHRDYPVAIINNEARGIRFDGPPREILIDGKPFIVPMNCSREARFGNNRRHIMAFGGPAHEVIVDGKWYELKFGGPPKDIQLVLDKVSMQLIGPTPAVKILGELVTRPCKIIDLTEDMEINPMCAVLPDCEDALANDPEQSPPRETGQVVLNPKGEPREKPKVEHKVEPIEETMEVEPTAPSEPLKLDSSPPIMTAQTHLPTVSQLRPPLAAVQPFKCGLKRDAKKKEKLTKRAASGDIGRFVSKIPRQLDGQQSMAGKENLGGTGLKRDAKKKKKLMKRAASGDIRRYFPTIH